MQDKLSLWYVDHFEILEKIGVVTYHFTLSPSFVRVHNVFHVSMLKKYVPDPDMVEFESLQLREDLSYEKRLVKVVDRKE